MGLIVLCYIVSAELVEALVPQYQVQRELSLALQRLSG